MSYAVCKLLAHTGAAVCGAVGRPVIGGGRAPSVGHYCSAACTSQAKEVCHLSVYVTVCMCLSETYCEPTPPYALYDFFIQ